MLTKEPNTVLVLAVIFIIYTVIFYFVQLRTIITSTIYRITTESTQFCLKYISLLLLLGDNKIQQLADIPVNKYCPCNNSQEIGFNAFTNSIQQRDYVASKKNNKSLTQVPMPRMSTIDTAEVGQEVKFQKVVIHVD